MGAGCQRRGEMVFARIALRSGSEPLRKRGELLVPDLLFAEMGNILWKRVRRQELAAGEASAILRSLRALPLKPTSSWSLALAAAEIAWSVGISVYDALYLALAVREKAQMVTADARLVAAVAATPLAKWVLPLARVQ